MEVIDVYEPKTAGLERIEEKRIIAAMDTILSKEPLDEKDIG